MNTFTVLNHLTGGEPNWRTGSQGYAQFKELLKMDLQRLLNTRRPYLPQTENITLLNYGLPDLSQFNPGAEEDCEALRQAIQTTLTQFEPRLQAISVDLMETESADPFILSLKISGHLAMAEQPLVEFISSLNPTTHQLYVEEAP
jgi:type VI secretion system lysozyme-like protein